MFATKILFKVTIINLTTHLLDMEPIWLAVTQVKYMITKGSWSSVDSTKNNVVTAFNYYKDDIILITYDPEESKIVFKKKGTEETYTL